MGQHGVVTDLLEVGVREPQPRCGAEVHGLAAAHVDVEPLVAAFDERRRTR